MSASLSIQTLDSLLAPFAVSDVPAGIRITGIASDSRQVKPGYVFFACQGAVQDGIRFIADAVAQGAVAIVVDAESVEIGISTTVVKVKDLQRNLGFIASHYYGDPTQNITLIGVTGTNGKTSCSHLIAQCLDNEAARCGIVGTMGYGFISELHYLANTTPGPVELQAKLNDLYQRGASRVAMEVSSHGMEQNRTVGCNFSVAVFTNLSRDHLDYHGSMEAYGKAKLQLFADDTLTAAIVNLDDDFASQVIAAVPANVEIIGITLNDASSPALDKVIRAKIVEKSLSGTRVEVVSSWGNATFSTHLLGDFNVSNVLLVLAVALQQGLSLEGAVARIAELHAPKGRLESFSQAGKPLVVVDYAHTPDALQKVLQTLHAHTEGDLWVVFGCGGDRDAGKRPLMGAVAEQYAQHICLTDDNPRTESSHKIIEDILSGIKEHTHVMVAPSRELAIRDVINSAAANDIVLVAGKGHEDYQIIGDKVFPFSDSDVVMQVLQEVA